LSSPTNPDLAEPRFAKSGRTDLRDARKLSSETLRHLRRRAVAAVESGTSQSEVARLFAVSRPTVNRWIQAYRAHGDDSFQPRRRGRRTRQDRWLTTAQQSQTLVEIAHGYPDSVGLAHRLWTRQAVADLISEQHGLQFSLTAVSNYLRDWGVTLPLPLPNASGRDAGTVRRWRTTEYSRMAKEARTDGSVILWISWLPPRQSVPRPPTDALPGCGNGDAVLSGMNLLSAVSNRRSLFFGVYAGSCEAPLFCEFLDRLCSEVGRTVQVISDSIPISEPEVLQSWLRANSGRVSAHFPFPRSGDRAPHAVEAKKNPSSAEVDDRSTREIQ
jgi:transposase